MSNHSKTENPEQFVAWFRHASPYIHAHHGKTFVISFEGAAVAEPVGFQRLMHDLAVLHSLGIRLVLVHGTRLQIERNLQERGEEAQYAEGMRITDDSALKQVKATCGEIIADIHAQMSMGLTHSPHLSAGLKLMSGNFITARPLGVRDGIDFMHTGEVRRVDYHAIFEQLDNNAIVLISPLGYSPTGEIFNLSVEDVSTSVAIALKADKWLCLTETEEPLSQSGFLTLTEAEERLESGHDNRLSQRQLRSAIRACQQGVNRVHVVQRRTDGGIFLELFSREGVGTMVSRDPFEDLRAATINDIAGIINLISPLERQGVLVPRPREKLETDIEHFIVQERDGAIIACAAVMSYKEDNMAELACVAVNAQYKNQGRGDVLLAFAQKMCEAEGINRLFVLTTRTAHWFQERGFSAAAATDLPLTKRALYNYQRNSKVFIKQL